MATPLMDQYHRIKKQHPDAILFFRLGDFYEMFYEDAKTAARVLGITLTGRMKGDLRVPMAGIPYHAAATYINRLLRAGLRVAVCDQMEDPETAAGEIVDREVTRVVTPGTLIDEGLLEEKRNNFLAAVCGDGPVRGLAWIDCSTGEFRAADVDRTALFNELARLAPSEILVPAAGEDAPDLDDLRRAAGIVTPFHDWTFDRTNALKSLCDHFGTVSLDGFGCGDLAAAVGAAGAVLEYLHETHRASLRHVTRLVKGTREGLCLLDRASIRALELTESLREGDRKTSLLGVLDRTRTAMGGRLLREWILGPLADVEAIRRRQAGVRELVMETGLRGDIRNALHGMGDLERLAGKVGASRATPRDLGGLRDTLEALPRLAGHLAAAKAGVLAGLRDDLALPGALAADLRAALVDQPPHVMKEGGIFRSGFHGELDRLQGIGSKGKSWIAAFEADEIRRTGIPSLKVGFNSVFGYYLEVTNTHREKIPADYHRKQTLKNAERYVTPALKKQEEEILHAEERARKLAYELFVELRDRVARHIPELQRVARAVAALDVLAALADAAVEHDYVLPEVDDGGRIEIVDGRHPVVERTISDRFVPNDVVLDAEGCRVVILTGPNMAGKSTYIRQVAVLVLMAQMGGAVPAKTARVGIADRIFTRVGAADDLARGASTFMVEMNETAAILHNATDRSLVILDEVGRGTSTYDGLSIAWAVTEHLLERIRARTLFATHYHELTEISRLLPGVRNYHVAVREWGDGVVFLHKILEGGTDKSYGLHVARLAGVPKGVIERAKSILAALEEAALDETDRPRVARKARGRPGEPTQLSLFAGPRADEGGAEAATRVADAAADGNAAAAEPGHAPRIARAIARAKAPSPAPPSDDVLRDALEAIDVNRLTPLQAMDRLAELKRMAGNGADSASPAASS
jgi:DNA mismatch repair protein MutS